MTDCDLEAWLRRGRTTELRAGELLAGIRHRACAGLEQHPGALPRCRLRALQALCRADVTEHAAALYNATGNLTQAIDHDAMALSGAHRQEPHARACTGVRSATQTSIGALARLTRRCSNRYGGHYPAVNAATTFLFAGDHRPGAVDGASAASPFSMLRRPGFRTRRRRARRAQDEQAKESAAERYYQAWSAVPRRMLVLGDADAAVPPSMCADGSAEHGLCRSVRACLDPAPDATAYAMPARHRRRCRCWRHLAPPRVVALCSDTAFSTHPRSALPDARQEDGDARGRASATQWRKVATCGLAVGSLAAGRGYPVRRGVPRCRCRSDRGASLCVGRALRARFRWRPSGIGLGAAGSMRCLERAQPRRDRSGR